jgi:chromate transporter
MGAIAAGLVTATGLKLMGALEANVLGVPVCTIAGVLVFAAVALMKLPLAWVLLGVGGACVVLAFRKLA